MTKEENIATLNEHLDHWKRLLSEKICDQDEGEKTIDALQNAIKALEQEPCEDCISRQAVLDKMKERDEELSSICTKDIRDLPSVTPQPKIGQWEKRDVRGQRVDCCSVCGLSNGTIYEYNYCPNCGAKMENEI